MSEKEQLTVKMIFDVIREGEIYKGVTLLYQHHYRKMYGVAFSIVKKEDVSQDVVHNVVYKLLQLSPGKFPGDHEMSWLYTVVKNEALLFLRSNTSVSPIEDAHGQIAENCDINKLVDMDHYYYMVKGLNEEQRQIVTLKVLGGFTHRDIAAMLGKPVGTVQWIYHTSVKKLKEILSFVLISAAVILFVSISVHAE